MAPTIIYTSYFDNWTAFDDRFALIGIAGKSPSWWEGPEYKKLAPTKSIWNEWHASMLLAKDQSDSTILERNACERYAERFVQERLGKFKNPHDALNDIVKLAKGKIPVLMCYEKPGEFCHRHLVAKWLDGVDGAIVEEYEVVNEVKNMNGENHKGVVYRQSVDGIPAMDSSDIAREYRQYGDELAKFLSEIDSMRERIQWLHDLTKDNADVAYELNEVVRELGIALSTCLTYAKSYENEANGIQEE